MKKTINLLAWLVAVIMACCGFFAGAVMVVFLLVVANVLFMGGW